MIVISVQIDSVNKLIWRKEGTVWPKLLHGSP